MSKNNPFDLNKVKVPGYVPWISNSDKKAVLNSLNSNMLTLGPILNKFEKSFSKYTKSKYSVGVTNGTAALHLSLMALGISKGDEVIIPDLAFLADANSIIACGGKPILADILDDFTIDPKSIEKKISKKTKAVIAIHTYGKPCDLKSITKICKKNKIHLVEDCAHAVGTFYENKHVGNFGIVGCFSFYPTKNMTTGEGGMITSNSKVIAAKISQLRSHGMTKSLKSRYLDGYPWIFDVVKPGLNYRMDELRASLGLSQLSRISEINLKRKNAANYYSKKLEKIDGIIVPEIVKDLSHSYHLYTIRITKNFGHTRNQVFKFLKNNGVRSTVYWLPIHNFSAYKQFVKHKTDFKNTTKLYNEILSLPLYPNITKKEQDFVIKLIQNFSKSN